MRPATRRVRRSGRAGQAREIGDAAATRRSPEAAAAGRLLLDGAAGAGPVLGVTLRALRDELTGYGLHWTAGAVDELADQLRAYTERTTHHRKGRTAELLTELDARHRTGRHGEGGPRQNPMRRARLLALGCRVSGDRTSQTAEAYLAHAATGTAPVLRHRWQLPERAADVLGPVGAELKSRRLGGLTLGRLAVSLLVTEEPSAPRVTPCCSAGHVASPPAARRSAPRGPSCPNRCWCTTSTRAPGPCANSRRGRSGHASPPTTGARHPCHLTRPTP
ncbi:hypothetical protein OHB05_00035 [Streptomyces sp. NBC_00638]|uniref:hypothetical protein n=1 Tax=unclassified Streptomyces TaxID=2593676 RepID=UPI00225C313B|nr:hypothetical protein [Streptomyces sp. NBC_00638]MCX5001026.1 hypothetical protein [Streptomyces sp. NBC_00638]